MKKFEGWKTEELQYVATLIAGRDMGLQLQLGESPLYEELIRDICLKLPDLYLYSADQKIGTKEYIKDISTKSWFHERVFDIYLWSK